MDYYLKATLSFLAGAALLCFFSVIQKGIIGSPFAVETFLNPLLIGGLCGLLISLREGRLNQEIRSRIQAEEKLVESEVRQRTIVDSIGMGIMVIDPEGYKIVQVNPEASRIIGIHPDEIVGKKCHELICEAQEGKCPVFDLGQEVDNSEQVLLTADGTEVPVFKTVIPIQLNGRTHYLEGFIDISKRRQAEDALRGTVDRFKSLTNHLNVGYFRNTPGPRGEFIEANTSICNMFGYGSREEFFEKTVSDLYQDPDERKLISTRILQDGVIKNKRLRLKRKDGTLLLGSVSTAVVKNGKGEIAYFDGIIEDVTEKVAAERKIEKLQKQILQAHKMEAIGTLAGGIAHDFNNILSAVIGYTELALFDVEEGSHLHGSLTEVLHAGNRATDLVKQILTFSRQSEHVAKPVHLNSLVKEALKMLRSTIPTSIDLQEHISNKFLTVKADPTQIHQVVFNLVTNASHAVVEDGGFIAIELKPVILDRDAKEVRSGWEPGSYARLTITDNGSGISKEHIDHIFEPYFTTKEKHKGTGLGLSVVHGIIETYNGHITVDSEVKQGTTFNIYFPLARQAVVVDTAVDWTGPLPVGREHILFVDDESAIVDIQKQILKQLGYTVTVRTSSTEALEAFRSMPEKFDMVITDMAMPNITGDKLAQEIKEIRPDVPVILCTGFSEKLNHQHAFQMNIDGFLMKPVDKRKMAITIKKVLRATKAEPKIAAMA
ncbi:MAG: PAS domain S-box protein [Thermodesulfobacteriota bacterium]|nr:PAS domain S-box protein [Thermodesulfobacteriota bacterium]